ncbi:MAG: hypothetical protein NVS9B1_22660 [Candidatus Dormibacteraceae bacterium]
MLSGGRGRVTELSLERSPTNVWKSIAPGMTPIVCVFLLTIGCGTVRSGGETPEGPIPGANVNIDPGKSAPYSLYTHCGIRSAQINGQVFYALPPAGDGSGNPPRGWGNPMDTGTMTLHGDGTADFRDPAGNSARFTSHPAGPTPSIPICA